MGRQWGPAMRVAEQAGCVVSASRAGQPEAGSWSCSGVILSRSPGLVLCHGGIFTPFLRAGSGALTAAGISFLTGDSCGDDLRLHVQWGSDAAALAALLPPEVGAPRGLLLGDSGPPWAAAAVLVECGTVWGSGVAVAPRLVVTCRHVAPRETARVLVRSATPKNVVTWGHVVFATQETSPYDIAVVSLEEDLDGAPLPVPAKHFHEGIVTSNTRDNNTGATYPHLNFSVPITVLQPALEQYSQTGDLGGLRELDRAAVPVRVVWRLQRPLTKAPQSKL
ncbi:PREDICTED: peroxisomal leader peptide-processing protease [Galeopterus variegatus]|uniref:Peroxisomal leader peptide-processing protease n=1 Tax=Galeopterus variegatus TaxID=482537 RepID=A0ABM0SK10_GALVR|nr:PREDICTED: peroxisomal leader peptide-processing protease [Galeopterus variegatus]